MLRKWVFSSSFSTQNVGIREVQVRRRAVLDGKKSTVKCYTAMEPSSPSHSHPQRLQIAPVSYRYSSNPCPGNRSHDLASVLGQSTPTQASHCPVLVYFLALFYEGDSFRCVRGPGSFNTSTTFRSFLGHADHTFNSAGNVCMQ